MLMTAFGITALLGAGCIKTGGGIKSEEPSVPKASVFEGTDSLEAAKHVNFVVGSIIEMKEKIKDFGTDSSNEINEGVRTIVIERFATGAAADLSWKLVTKIETEDSKLTRSSAVKAKTSVPEPVMVDRTRIGIIRNFELSNSHLSYPPSYWPEKEEAPAFASGGLWLSDDAFAGLSRNRVATLDFGLLHPSLISATTLPSEIQRALDSLKSEMMKIENRIDVYRLDGDKDLAQWPLKVNGYETKVSAIKAHSWFGEIVVLNNPQNPLILKFDLNPAVSGEILKNFAGYEITSLRDVWE